MLTDDERRDNLRELWDLLEAARAVEYEKYGMTYRGGTFRDVIALHTNAGLLGERCYDTALPQSWWDDFFTKTGEPPYGIVWSYDGVGILGGPYAITTDGARRLDAYLKVRAHRPVE